MSKVIETTVYTFDELSDKAKQSARNWWLEGGLNYEWWDSVYEDAHKVGITILAFDTGRSSFLEAAFNKSVPEIADLILENHGENCDTHKLAKQFMAEYWEDSRRFVKAQENDDNAQERAISNTMDGKESEFKRALREEYLSILRKEYEYLTSDEQIGEAIRANEYTFTEDGKRFG